MNNSLNESLTYSLSLSLSKVFEESREKKKLDYELGSDNVFEDLGLHNAEELKTKTLKKIQKTEGPLKKNIHAGSSFDDFLKAEGIFEHCQKMGMTGLINNRGLHD